jgi:hypothetical protein
MEYTKCNVTPLTLAFLVGYSIETFLTLLDRLVLLTSQRIAGLGEASPNTSVG